MALMEKNKWLSILSLLASLMIWGASFIATRVATAAFSPILLGVVRFFASALVLMIVSFLQRKPVRIAPQDYKAVFITGLFGITIYYTIENYGVAMTSAGNAAVITAIYPITTLLLGVLFFHDHVSLRQIIGILLAVLGIAVLTASPIGEGGRKAWIGNILLLANGFNWGLYNYMTQSISRETDTASLTLMQSVIASFCSLPLLAFDLPITVGPLTPAVIFSLLFLVIGCSSAAYYLYNFALRGVSAGTAAAMVNLMPVFGLFFAWSILHEKISSTQLLGSAIVLFGVFLSTVPVSFFHSSPQKTS